MRERLFTARFWMPVLRITRNASQTVSSYGVSPAFFPSRPLGVVVVGGTTLRFSILTGGVDGKSGRGVLCSDRSARSVPARTASVVEEKSEGEGSEAHEEEKEEELVPLPRDEALELA